ncbi:hypothetical protein EPUS_02075 [Endocarpon pusillum Z07020]|uniref:ERCC4 domain-containing protein n=1 Tax=Endocarpon pusillum (strain Z07020 / HMAS-L-300199) TaxID=1263415 RepID=U1GPX9_ENDPU|nr:uncharacterized protein EPUS_02075 [Endocarpon pusillum Z07020]ERF74388.1 hypothetical protein EPUS_02075 [Endocarpon pusillum Z07020]
MPEIIDLLSSPINSPQKSKQTKAPRSRVEVPSENIFDISSDVLSSSSFPDDLDFLSAQPKKKRRLSPPEPKPTKSKESCKYSFLSSDGLNDILNTENTSISKTTIIATTTNVEDVSSDPITFPSSAPEPRTVRRATKAAFIDVEVEDLNEEDVFSLSQPIAPTRAPLSERTANLPANITGPGKGGGRYEATAYTASTETKIIPTATSKATKRSTIEDNITSSPPKRRRKLAKDKDACTTDRAAAKARKEKEKEAEKERKRLAKEEKAREKQLAADIAEVNKSKTDKKNSTPEMIVDMARSLEGTSVGNQILEHMKILGVDTTFFDEQLDLSKPTEVGTRKGNLVRWRRKLKAKYNEAVGHWEPIPVEKVEIEKHVLLHVTAREFFEICALGLSLNQELATQEKAMTKNLDAHVASLRSQYKECKLIYLIEGLSSFLRKNKTAKNRAYTAAVRSQMTDDDHGHPPASSQPRRKKNNQKPTTPVIDLSSINEDLTETLLLHLQLHAKILIHQSASASLSAEWIKSFTEHISTIPYRHLRMSANDAVGFCMDVGQVKTGDDRMDTYVKMLQEVQRVTPSMAYGIANEFDTVGKLVKAFREEGPLVLQNIRKSANRDGAVSERVLGQAVSRRLSKVWLGKEEGSTDGIA